MPVPESRIVMLGLDAFDPATALRFIAEGALPNLAELMERSMRATVRNPVGLFVGALWPTFATCLRPDRHGVHCWDKVEIESYRHCLTRPELNGFPTFWKQLSDAGRKVAVIDVPHMKAEGPLNGVQVAEWGCHDRHFGLHSWPPDRARKIVDLAGLHPVLGIDPYADRSFAPDDCAHRTGRVRTLEEERSLLEGLSQGVRRKEQISVSIVAEEKWDFYLSVFGEAHAVGHQQWYLHDETHPWFDPSRQAAIGGDPLLRLYREMDRAVGETLAAAGPGATLLVLMSHGMRAHYDGGHLLDRVLERLDACYGDADAGHGKWDPIGAAIRSASPKIRDLAATIALPEFVRGRLAGIADERGFARARARQRFFVEPNNTVYGGVRLNLKGREPQGRVDPAEAAALCERLERDLLEIINVETGRPAIRAVIRSDVHYRRRAEDVIPDLFVDWDRAAPVEKVASPRIGTVHIPYEGWRSGDHSEDGLLLACAPDLPPGHEAEPLNVEDIGASIAARLGVTLDGVDGRRVPWLAGA